MLGVVDRLLQMAFGLIGRRLDHRLDGQLTFEVFGLRRVGCCDMRCGGWSCVRFERDARLTTKIIAVSVKLLARGQPWIFEDLTNKETFSPIKFQHLEEQTVC